LYFGCLIFISRFQYAASDRTTTGHGHSYVVLV